MDLLNYVSLRWGRLCIPHPDDKNKARWELAPLWIEIRQMIEEWSFNYEGQAKRSYEFRPDLSEAYLQSASGWIAGLMARLGIENGTDHAASLRRSTRPTARTVDIHCRKRHKKNGKSGQG